MLDVKSSAAATLQHALVKHPLLVTVPRSSATGCTEDVKRKSFELECPGFKWNGFQQQSKRREHQRRLDIGYAWRSAKSWTWLRGRKWNGMHKPGLKNYMNVKTHTAMLRFLTPALARFSPQHWLFFFLAITPMPFRCPTPCPVSTLK